MFPVIVVAYVATSLVNKDEYTIYYPKFQYKVLFTYDRLGRAFVLFIFMLVLLCFFVLLSFLGE